MITKNVTLTVKDDKATLSDKIILYQGDKGIEIYFTLVGFNYKFKSNEIGRASCRERVYVLV